MSDTVVVDANFALKWVLLEEDSYLSLLLLDKWTDEGKTVIAPALFAYEVTIVLHRQSVTEKLTYDEARRGLEKLFSHEVQIKFALYEEVSAQAMEFAQRFHLPATYDAHYLALAYKEQCECWTAGRRLWTGVQGELTWVHCFGEPHFNDQTFTYTPCLPNSHCLKRNLTVPSFSKTLAADQ